MNAEFFQYNPHSSTELSSPLEISAQKSSFWHKNTQQITFSRIHHGSRCFSVVPASALHYSVASCSAASPPLDVNIFSGSHKRITSLIPRAKMTKTREPKPPKSSRAANDNASDGSINLNLHKFVLLLNKQSDRKVMKHQFPEKPANDNTLEAKALIDEDLEKGTDNTSR